MKTTYEAELLQSALQAREREVIEYQVNIDNFRLAIERVGDDEDLQPFKENLQNLLYSSLIEHKKASIMLSVVRDRLQEE